MCFVVSVVFRLNEHPINAIHFAGGRRRCRLARRIRDKRDKIDEREEINMLETLPAAALVKQISILSGQAGCTRRTRNRGTNAGAIAAARVSASV